MYVHEEHVCDEAVKKHLKHKYMNVEKASDGDSDQAAGMASHEHGINEHDPISAMLVDGFACSTSTQRNTNPCVFLPMKLSQVHPHSF